MRIAKFLASCGVASRRKSEVIILEGRVSIDGAVITDLAFQVSESMDVELDGQPLKQNTKTYFLLHKPKGVLSTMSDPHGGEFAIDLIPGGREKGLFNVGRLDQNSEGLLLFSNDGDWANHIMHPSKGILKTYLITVKGEVMDSELRELTAGIEDEGDLLKAKVARVVHKRRFETVIEVILNEGKNRELRRMARAMGFHMQRLIRTQVGPVELGQFNPGFSRELTKEELQQF
ncbi:MAG: rRNA pseudouridine synthase [Lentisphaeria bacterium]|nr:rRNA pseudouridine synthase [Lentisphaeria bacterium]